MHHRFSCLLLALVLHTGFGPDVLLAQLYEIKHETVNASGWFGGDNRPMQQRTVGVGQSVLIDTTMTIRSFSFFFSGPFDFFLNPEGKGHAVTLILNVRDTTGAVLRTVQKTVPDSFSFGWISWEGINLPVTANTILIFTCHQIGAYDSMPYTTRQGADENMGYAGGNRYVKNGISDEDMESWSGWVEHQSWDSAFRLTGTLGPPPTFANLDYTGKGNLKQTLDLYIPAGLTRPAPLAIFIHGGGWQSGNKGFAMSFCDTLFANGYIVADLNYRLSGDSLFPAQIFDCKAAVRWLKAHAPAFNIDTCKIGVVGESAGAHLTSLLGTTAGVDSLEDFSLGSHMNTSRVHAAIVFYPAIDFLQMDGHFPQTPPDSCADPYMHDAPNSVESELLGCQISICPDRVRAANPITYIDASDVPFRLFHGTYDCISPPNQSVLMDSALREANVFSSLTLVQHAEHAFHPNALQKQSMLAFLNQKLSPCTTTGMHDTPDLPLRFELDQNFPNPFNRSTTIRFSLPQREHVTLKVFDLNGRLLATLVDENLPAGDHSVAYAPGEATPGLYFYKLTAGKYSHTRKAVLLK
jgi:acetyl esterase/lipase